MSWKDRSVTVGAYVPKEIYDRLVYLADLETAKTGDWWSLSKFVKKILIEYVEKSNLREIP